MTQQVPLPSFQRGRLAERTSCNLETIRYYEKIGLLPEPPRTGNGYRAYTPAHEQRLHFIRRARELGFTLDEVRTLLGLSDGGNRCGEIHDLAALHLRSVQDKIAQLQSLQAVLARMVAQCRAGDLPDCPIIEALSTPAAMLRPDVYSK